MKRTLIAVGVAILASMMWIPEYVPYQGRHRVSILSLQYDIEWPPLILQTIFIAVLFALVVNIPWPRRKKDDSD